MDGSVAASPAIGAAAASSAVTAREAEPAAIARATVPAETRGATTATTAATAKRVTVAAASAATDGGAGAGADAPGRAHDAPVVRDAGSAPAGEVTTRIPPDDMRASGRAPHFGGVAEATGSSLDLATPTAAGGDAASGAGSGFGAALTGPATTGSQHATNAVVGGAPSSVPHFEVGLTELGTALPRAVRVTLDAGGREAILELRPPELGAIRVELNLDGRDLGARFQAERADVALRLEQHRGELERALESVGLRLQDLQVETRGAGSDAGARQGPQNFAQPEGGRREGHTGTSSSGSDGGRSGSGRGERSPEAGRAYGESGTNVERPGTAPGAARFDRRV